MSSTNSGIGNDDQFVAFMFAIVSVVTIGLYVPWIWGIIERMVNYATRGTTRRRGEAEEKNPFVELLDAVLFIPRVLMSVASNPVLVTAGVSALMAQPALTLHLYLPKFLRFIIRPKILFLWLWVLLFSSVMYTTLTFDGYKILGLPSDASLSDVKQAYRQLSKLNHPDINKTDAARVIYAQVKKAYKSIVNKEDFEEESRNEDFSVNVALPSFLTAQENETFVLFGTLFLMLGIPLGIWYKFRDSDKKVVKLLEKIKGDKACVAAFLEQLGVPADPKYMEKKLSRSEVLTAVKNVGLAPPQATEAAVMGFPLFPAFVARCINPENFISMFKNLGFDEEGVHMLNQWAMDNGEKSIELYERRLAELCKGATGSNDTIPPIPNGKYRAIRYLMEIHTAAVQTDLEELQKSMPGELRSLRRIATIHREMYDLLTFVFEREKAIPRHVQQLTDIVRELDEVMEEVIPEIEKVMRKFYKQYYEQQVGKKALKRMQKMARQAPAGGMQQ